MRWRSTCIALIATWSAFAASGSASATEEIERVGPAIPATHTSRSPSSQFAQIMMLSQSKVSLLEPGVLALWSPLRAFPHSIFVAGDGFESFGLCTEREAIGCTMGTLKFSTKEISSYIMPLELAQTLSTFVDLPTVGQPNSPDIARMRTEEFPNLSLSTPSATFARLLLETPSPVIELELGVIAVGFLDGSHSGYVFAGLDGLQAFGTCGGEHEGCVVSMFDYGAGTIQDYKMPLSAAKRADTYLELLGSFR